MGKLKMSALLNMCFSGLVFNIRCQVLCYMHTKKKQKKKKKKKKKKEEEEEGKKGKRETNTIKIYKLLEVRISYN